MQRLLRGRALYLLLGAMSLMLYGRLAWREAQQGVGVLLPEAAQAPAAAEKTVAEETLETGLEVFEPERLRRIARQAPALALMLWVQLAGALGMVVTGLILTGRGWRSGRRQVGSPVKRRPPPAWTMGEVWRIGALAVVVLSLMPFVRLAFHYYWPNRPLDTHEWMVWTMLWLDGVVILAVIAFAAGRLGSARKALGMSRMDLTGPIAIGFRSYVTTFPWLLALLVVVASVMDWLGISPPREPLHALIFEEERSWVLGLTIMLACLVGPVAEELYFRGVIYAALRQRLSRIAAMVLSGAVFAAFHLNPVGFLPMMALGCLLAYLYERTGSLASPLAIHIFHNAFLLNGALVLRQAAAFA